MPRGHDTSLRQSHSPFQAAILKGLCGEGRSAIGFFRFTSTDLTFSGLPRSNFMDQTSGSPAPVADGQQSADASCVRRTLAGDVRAFDELIERYQRRIVSIAYRLLGNGHDAADVCQEAFLRAYRSLDTLQEPHRFGAWLTRIAGNLALNYR